MKAAAIVWIALVLVACASPPAQVVRDCPALPVLPLSPTAVQRGQHTEAIVALYLRCAGVTP